MHDFDKEKFFEGCLPIEVMAHRGVDTLRFGPMKPVGLIDPRTGREPYAAVQLRQDNLAGDHYSLVGFQTQIKWGEQARVLRLIPGLEQAEFVRFGMVHRNTYVNGPTVLAETWQVRARPSLFLRRPDVGRGRVRRVGRVRPARRAQRGRAGARRADVGSAADDGHRRAGVLRVACQPGALRAVEHHVRHHAAARRRRAARWSGNCDSGRALGLDAMARHDSDRATHDRSSQELPAVSRAESQRLAAHGARLRQRSDAVPRARGRPDRCQARATSTPSALDRGAIRSFLAALHAQRQSRATAARKLAAVRTFLRYLRREGVDRRRSRRAVATPKREVRMPAHLSEDEMRALLEAPPATMPLGGGITRSSSCSMRRGFGAASSPASIWTT